MGGSLSPMGPGGKPLPAAGRGPEQNLLCSFRAEGLEGRAPRALGPWDRRPHSPSLCEELQSVAVGPQLRAPGKGSAGCWQRQEAPPGSPAGPGRR